MPADLKRVALVGRLTRDPSTGVDGSGTPVARLRLAVTTRQPNAGGEWIDTPSGGRRQQAASMVADAVHFLASPSICASDTDEGGSKRGWRDVAPVDDDQVSF